ncbi:haloacid dehalogenase-like hydrolase domain-containing 5 [Mytilus trossulus]|uniref:haloacid dehalogenase-like hydrolase domain-containing 5 n=1 Tax=Mytilus trossulus TaxID=6551 RepID=UPI003006BFB7
MRIVRFRADSEEMYYSDTGSDYGDSSDDETIEQAQEPDFGILFDVDGVLARGLNPLDPAIRAINKLKDSEGNMKVPVAFVTNSCSRSRDKAAMLERWFDTPVSPEACIHAPTPAKLLTSFHNKHVLVIGQEHRKEIAEEIGFVNTCTVEDVRRAYPFLDMVDHENRRRVSVGNFSDNLNFKPVEAILLIGEPKRWESSLQLLIDLLMTEGKPTKAPESLSQVKQLPIIACNMDLVFMAEACMPRFGHGAFLVCLEALYKKITGKPLEYEALIGKPCEITYRFAEHTVAELAKKMGIKRHIKKLYFVGDNPNVDIVGCNLYERFLKDSWINRRNGNRNNSINRTLPRSRSIPCDAALYEQTVTSMESLLVGTGVYNPEKESETTLPEDKVYHGHRDIAHEPELATPTRYVEDVDQGISYILEKEHFTITT